ncbi:hypothetical protein EV1_042325 [Malus domestica]
MSLDQFGSELSNREDFDGFGKNGDLPSYAVEMLEKEKDEWINSIRRSIVQHSSLLADSKVVDYDSSRQ